MSEDHNEKSPAVVGTMPTIRLFPLPDHVFLPDLPTPYRVFEPRYKQLIEDLLKLPENERWIAIPCIDDPVSPGFCPISTVGKVVEIQDEDQGVYNILVRGVFRAKLTEISSQHPYRLARVRPWPDLGYVDQSLVSKRFATIFQMVLTLNGFMPDTVRVVTQALRGSPDRSTLAYRLGSIFLSQTDLRLRLLEARNLEDRLAILEDALASVLAAAHHASSSETSVQHIEA